MQVRYLQGDPRASLLELDVPGDGAPRRSSLDRVERQRHRLPLAQHVDLTPRVIRRHGL
jgi:hypothetical protein